MKCSDPPPKLIPAMVRIQVDVPFSPKTDPHGLKKILFLGVPVRKEAAMKKSKFTEEQIIHTICLAMAFALPNPHLVTPRN